jgi:hypothetical protein
MVALRVGRQYVKDRAKLASQLKGYEGKIAKAVDLFSRVKSTEQAEEVLTVLYASKQLKQNRDEDHVTEQDIYDYVLEWKKSWNSEEKKHAVASAIRNLILLGWMRAEITESLHST